MIDNQESKIEKFIYSKQLSYLRFLYFFCASIFLIGCSKHSYYSIRPVKHTFSEITFLRDGTFQDCLCLSSGEKHVKIGNWSRQGDTITTKFTKWGKRDSILFGDLIDKMSELRLIVEDDMLYSLVEKDNKLVLSYEFPYRKGGLRYRRKCRGRYFGI
jgi:hypothetical protein